MLSKDSRFVFLLAAMAVQTQTYSGEDVRVKRGHVGNPGRHHISQHGGRGNLLHLQHIRVTPFDDNSVEHEPGGYQSSEEHTPPGHHGGHFDEYSGGGRGKHGGPTMHDGTNHRQTTRGQSQGHGQYISHDGGHTRGIMHDIGTHGEGGHNRGSTGGSGHGGWIPTSGGSYIQNSNRGHGSRGHLNMNSHQGSLPAIGHGQVHVANVHYGSGGGGHGNSYGGNKKSLTAINAAAILAVQQVRALDRAASYSFSGGNSYGRK